MREKVTNTPITHSVYWLYTVAPTCFGITLPSSGSVPSTFLGMLNWEAVGGILLIGVLCLVTWCGQWVFHTFVNEMHGSRSSVAPTDLIPALKFNVTFWWCKWTVHKDIYFTFCINTYVFVISDNIQPVNLPLPTDGDLVGVTAAASGWGRAETGKCIAKFNLQGNIKDDYYTVGATWMQL
jgi:hypothetical protein